MSEEKFIIFFLFNYFNSIIKTRDTIGYSFLLARNKYTRNTTTVVIIMVYYIFLTHYK